MRAGGDARRGRQLARWSVFPLTLAVALGGSLAALHQGVRPALLVLPVYFLLMPWVALLERWLPHRVEWNRSQGDLLTDGLYLGSTWGLGVFLNPAFTALAVALGGWVSSASGAGLWPVHWPLLAQVALACAVAEFFDYWAHRWMHESSLLWRFHAVHHSAPRVYWLNGTRTHPGEIVFRGLFGAVPLVALGVGEPVLALWAVIGRVAGLFQHANIDFSLGPLAWIFSIGELHRWHHSREPRESNSNYGNSFIFWDAVFGTRLRPADRTPSAQVGIAGLDAFPRTFPAQLLAPLRWSAIQRRSAAAP
jgi:sterol desaturase/sphingolipid hydroxylase (fatty acid hydroxylase superfamily)